ncbi:S-adenosyl-L-methionine-dependent methyltransferase [Entophlyctis helioformis]|nr:S-adenosyl-L-methionine-dependent methyltransferase [Entophlyctis helioformis]
MLRSIRRAASLAAKPTHTHTQTHTQTLLRPRLLAKPLPLPHSLRTYVAPPAQGASVDADEIRKFSETASQWWNPNGEYGLLHKMNPVRVRYMREGLQRAAAESRAAGVAVGVHPVLDAVAAAPASMPFQGLRVLDMGCGGGFLSEAIARLGGTVVGADASRENIAIASAHAAQDRSLSRGPGSIDYRSTTAEDMSAAGEQFDVVMALEIIEHVNDPKAFVHTCASLVKPGGYIFFSTINRTPASYLFTVLLAEHVLRWVPPGTHDHNKYIAPEELEMYLTVAGCQTLDISGIGFNPLRKDWFMVPKTGVCGVADLQMNYITMARKEHI